MKHITKTTLSFLFCLFASSVMAEVLDVARFDIKEGWNAIYLPVTPTNSADAIFAEWPVDKVGFYDQAAFLRTKQFDRSADDGLLGAVESGMKTWYRNEPGKSSFSALVANGIYIFKATQDVSNVVISGVPSAMRISWHVAVSTNAPLNFVGISTDGKMAELTQKGYFKGLDTGWTIEKGVIRDPWGFDETPTLDFFYDGTPMKGNLSVVAMDAAKASDWSGAFFVTPMDGIDLGTNLCQGAFGVRNDTGTDCVVRVELNRMDENLFTALPLPQNVLFLDPSRHSAWQDNFVGSGYERELVAGETLTLRLAVDRATFAQTAAGTEYGGLLSVTDVSPDGPTGFRTTVPFSIKSDGGAFQRSEWPKGLWRATLSLDKVSQTYADTSVVHYREEVVVTAYTNVVFETNATTQVVTSNLVVETAITTNKVAVYATDPTPAGSTMTMNVLLHVDANGAMKLVQRARVNGRRVSCVVMPTDGTVVSGTGTFGGAARFAWTVGEQSRANPFRHARHPDHDGLDSYFEKATPSGDDFSNYNGTVKPELFSVENELKLDWGESAARAAAWNPQETLSGTCTWKFTGLRHEGAITASGSFTMRRITSKDLNELDD